MIILGIPKTVKKIEVECDECGKKVRSIWNLKNHIRDDHGKKNKNVCSIEQTDAIMVTAAGIFTMTVQIQNYLHVFLVRKDSTL